MLITTHSINCSLRCRMICHFCWFFLNLLFWLFQLLYFQSKRSFLYIGSNALMLTWVTNFRCSFRVRSCYFSPAQVCHLLHISSCHNLLGKPSPTYLFILRVYLVYMHQHLLFTLVSFLILITRGWSYEKFGINLLILLVS